MIPVGYMVKRVSLHPDWLKAEQIVDLYSVSGCISKNFADYIPYWKHNGYWFFDAPEIIRQLAQDHSIDLNGTHVFYYEVYELEFDEEENEWMEFEPGSSFTTNVVLPSRKVLEGYDIVSFSLGTNAQCSPLSCNHLASEVETNQHCLLDSLEQAQHVLQSDKFKGVEPGPYRIFAVYSVEGPNHNIQ
jgi:hypothetical protein